MLAMFLCSFFFHSHLFFTVSVLSEACIDGRVPDPVWLLLYSWCREFFIYSLDSDATNYICLFSVWVS